MLNYTDQLRAYKEYLRLQNFALSTQKSYVMWTAHFLEFRVLQKITDPIDQEQARLFILYKLDHGSSWPTINCLYSALRKFFREVLELDWYVKKLPRPRNNKTLPQLMSITEVIRLIEHVPLYKHQVIVSVLYGTGLRLHEALQLKLSDIDGDRCQIYVEHGKGGKDRYVYLPDCLLETLRTYYKRIKPEKYLFTGRYKGIPLSSSAAQKAIKQGVLKAGILKQVTTHTLRHCYATHHLEAGTNLVFLQRQMGHKHLKTTARYIRLARNYHRHVKHPIQQMAIGYYKKNRR